MSFYNDIAEIPLLTKEDEVALARRIQAGDETARTEMIVSNLRLVVSTAKPFCCDTIGMAELVSEGNVGLMEAVDKFDPERGVKFSTYANGWIKRDMLRTLRDDSTSIRVPTSTYHKIQKIKKAKDEFKSLEGREATVAELVQKTNLAVSVVKKHYSYSRSVISMDEDGYRAKPKPCSEFEDYMARDELAYMNESLDKLPDRTAEILILLYGLRGHRKHTLVEIGKKIGLTYQRTQQVAH